MRAARLALASLVLLASSRVAARPRPARSMPPLGGVTAAASAGTDDAVAVLRTPGPDQVLVRGGTFLMGSTAADVAAAVAECKLGPSVDGCEEEAFAHEYPQHEVLLRDYWLDRTEVTVEHYVRCASAGRCRTAPLAPGAAHLQLPDRPMVLVTWYEAADYCAWAGRRLPTEAEWERAARGLRARTYPWGNVYNPHVLNHGRLALGDWTNLDASDGFLELAPVGSFPDGRTPDGLDDLAGNVEEWVQDWYASEYPSTSEFDPQGPSAGDFRVIRGGSFIHGRGAQRSAARSRDVPSVRRAWRGFRCARSP